MPEHFTPPHTITWADLETQVCLWMVGGSLAALLVFSSVWRVSALQLCRGIMCSPLPFFSLLLICATGSWAMDVTMPFMEYLDQEQLVCLKWGFDNPAGDITFQLAVNTTGWVGFGLSPNGDMKGSDIVIGGVGSSGSYFSVSYEIIINEQLLYFYLFSINSWKLSSSFILFNLILCFGFLFSFISVVLVWILLKIINFCLVFRFA